MAGGGARYRYKGHFISAGQAARYANLKNASKYLTTEYTFAGRSDHVHKGYKPSIEKLMAHAMAEQRARTRPDLTPAQQRKITREREAKRDEEKRLVDISRRAARRMEDEDIGEDEALDDLFDPDSFEHYSYDDAAAFTDRYYSEGESFGDEFEFDMADLEIEGERIS